MKLVMKLENMLKEHKKLLEFLTNMLCYESVVNEALNTKRSSCKAEILVMGNLAIVKPNDVFDN